MNTVDEGRISVRDTCGCGAGDLQPHPTAHREGGSEWRWFIMNPENRVSAACLLAILCAALAYVYALAWWIREHETGKGEAG